ncbi:HNH endonuclease signature motif containing protein [Demequina sp. NBRC 110053]|uniref:HNH endonuclease n=1 Tax=Demequina sp. NBRC 110053 TaxID=1570342 RepID=UPI0009FC482D|nr:HNH endonuclease signature motif containing protein [Demequina sp. NBRC 110053]
MTFSDAEWVQLHELLSSAAGEDISGLSKAELLEALEHVGRVSRTVGALEARFAGEVARRTADDLPGGGLARIEGHGDAPAMFSKVQGGSVPRAKRSVEAGDAFTPIEDDSPVPDESQEPALIPAPDGGPSAPARKRTRAKYPLVAGAQLVGDISVEAAAAIVNGLNAVAGRVSAQVLAELETRLVNKARTLDVNGVKRAVARAVARIDLDEHERQEKAAHDKRYLWWKQDHSGKVVIHGELDAVTAAPILTVLEQMTTLQVRQQARPAKPRAIDPVTGAITEPCGCQVSHISHDCAGPGACLSGHRDGCTGEALERRTIGQIRADVLHDLARHILGCTKRGESGVRTTVIVRMTLESLLRGQGLASIDGITTPVSARQARRLAGDAGFIPEVLAGDGTVMDFGRTRRLFTASQRTAMIGRDGGCAKCHAPPEYCEAHHIEFWERGGMTDLANGVMLCTRCHHDVHNLGWQIDVHGNRVSFVPPPHIDPSRTPQPGGNAVFDIDMTALHSLDTQPPPEITAEDEALVRQWIRDDHARHDPYNPYDPPPPATTADHLLVALEG